MTQFNVKYPSGLVDAEVVEDCDSIEAYANRKFGSVDWKEHGVEIEMIENKIEEIIPPVTTQAVEDFDTPPADPDPLPPVPETPAPVVSAETTGDAP